MKTYHIGAATIRHGGGQTVTVLADGSEVRADWTVQPGQEQTAREYGIPLDALNRTHDLAHAILAHVLGLPESPTLAGVVSGEYWPHWAREEAAALCVQALAHAAGVNLEDVAERLSQGDSLTEPDDSATK